MGWTQDGLADIVRRAMSEQRKQHGELVRDLRRARNWSQDDLAEQAGVSTKTISRFEQGRVENPERKTIAGIAAALGITEADIRGELPDLPITGAADQLDRIEALIRQVLELLLNGPG